MIWLVRLKDFLSMKKKTQKYTWIGKKSVSTQTQDVLMNMYVGHDDVKLSKWVHINTICFFHSLDNIWSDLIERHGAFGLNDERFILFNFFVGVFIFSFNTYNDQIHNGIQ